MYATKYNKDGTLKHSTECKMHFSHKDKECARCVELINGANPREGWQKSYFKNKANNEKMHSFEVEEHQRTCPICNGNTPGICTFGEW